MNAQRQSFKNGIKGSQRDCCSEVEHDEPKFFLSQEQEERLAEVWSRLEMLEEKYRTSGDFNFQVEAERVEAEYFAIQNSFYLQSKNETMNKKKLDDLNKEREKAKKQVKKEPSKENLEKLGDIIDKINEQEQKS